MVGQSHCCDSAQDFVHNHFRVDLSTLSGEPSNTAVILSQKFTLYNYTYMKHTALSRIDRGCTSILINSLFHLICTLFPDISHLSRLFLRTLNGQKLPQYTLSRFILSAHMSNLIQIWDNAFIHLTSFHWHPDLFLIIKSRRSRSEPTKHAFHICLHYTVPESTHTLIICHF